MNYDASTPRTPARASGSRIAGRRARLAAAFAAGLLAAPPGCSRPEVREPALKASESLLVPSPRPLMGEDAWGAAAKEPPESGVTLEPVLAAGAPAAAPAADARKQSAAGRPPARGLAMKAVATQEDALLSLGARETRTAADHPARGSAEASVPGSRAGSASFRGPPLPIASGLSGGAEPSAPPAADPLDDLFHDLRARFLESHGRPPADDFEAIERGDLEAKLIALFFLRDRKNLEDYRELIRSFREDGAGSVEVELLRAALYQRVGQADLRDRSLERATRAALPVQQPLRLTQLAFAREIRGFRSFTPLAADVFQPGEEVLLYGEIEGFRNAPIPGAGGGSSYRRSFSAELILRGGDGREIDRRELLHAGKAVEVVSDSSKPVHFWGRYPLPRLLAQGPYRLEIEANDLEGKGKARAALPLSVR